MWIFTQTNEHGRCSITKEVAIFKFAVRITGFMSFGLPDLSPPCTPLVYQGPLTDGRLGLYST